MLHPLNKHHQQSSKFVLKAIMSYLQRFRGHVNGHAHFLQQLNFLFGSQFIENFIHDDGDDSVRLSGIADVWPGFFIMRIDHFQSVRGGNINGFPVEENSFISGINQQNVNKEM